MSRVYYSPSVGGEVPVPQYGPDNIEWLRKKLKTEWEVKAAEGSNYSRLTELLFDAKYWAQRRYRNDEDFKSILRSILAEHRKQQTGSGDWFPPSTRQLSEQAVALLSSVAAGKSQKLEWFVNGLPCMRYNDGACAAEENLVIDGVAMEALLFAKLGFPPSALVHCCLGPATPSETSVLEFDAILGTAFGKGNPEGANEKAAHPSGGALEGSSLMDLYANMENADIGRGAWAKAAKVADSYRLTPDLVDAMENDEKAKQQAAARSDSQASDEVRSFDDGVEGDGNAENPHPNAVAAAEVQEC